MCLTGTGISEVLPVASRWKSYGQFKLYGTTRPNILVRFPHARIHTSRSPTGSDTDRQRQCRLDWKTRIFCLSVPVVAWYCEPLPSRRHDSTEEVVFTVFSNKFSKLTLDTEKCIELVHFIINQFAI